MADQKWNLGDIRAPERSGRPRRKRTVSTEAPVRRRTTNRIDASDADQQDSVPIAPTRDRGPRSGGKNKWLISGVVIVFLIIVGTITTILMRGADVTVYPKTREINVQATFTALQSPDAAELGYELLTLEQTGERTVAATGEETAEERATGEITIFNAYSTEPQRLVKNTRFETENGLIFRITESAVVPGYTMNNGTKVPGKVVAEVFADSFGEQYNVAPSKFTIPGLADTPQFTDMYAESQTAMRGGFIGSRLIVEESHLEAARTTMQDELREDLHEKVSSERPAGFILYENMATVRFEQLPAEDAGNGQALIRERAILEAPIFAEGDFARFLAQNTIPGYENEPVRLENIDNLSVSLPTAASTQTASSSDTFDFSISGTALVVWDYDEQQLREDLVGVAKTAVPSILTKYPAIQNIDTVIRPFWKQSFPGSIEDIRIIEVLE